MLLPVADQLENSIDSGLYDEWSGLDGIKITKDNTPQYQLIDGCNPVPIDKNKLPGTQIEWNDIESIPPGILESYPIKAWIIVNITRHDPIAISIKDVSSIGPAKYSWNI